MQTLTEHQLKEITEQLDCGFRSFVHKKTDELLFIPDFESNPYAEREFYEDELKNLDKHFSDFIEIEKPNSSDSFEMMVKFMEELNDNEKLKEELQEALNKNKPFRQFKFLIDNSGIYRQQWFDFKDAQLKEWVIEKFREASEDSIEDDSHS